MSDFVEPVSTALEPENATTTGGGAPPAEAKTAESHRESLEAVMKNADRRESDAAKKAEKAPEAGDKPEAAEPVEKTAEKVVKQEPQTETKEAPAKPEAEREPERQGEKRPEPPARFSEAAKTVWRNVPREAQHEIARWEKESEEARPRLERYESIREFDELAKSNGRDLRESLVKINQFENMMRTNPVGALNSILQEIGPRKPDGSAVSLLEVAQHIVSQGQDGYQRTIQQAQHQTEQDRQQQAAEQQQRVQMEQNKQLVRLAYIEPFRAAHPRYDELEDHIAMVLNSDMVDKSLSPPDRLARAYEVAERIIPASSSSTGDQQRAFEPERRADTDLSGSKSIKSSPGLVTDEDADDRAKPGEDILESIQKAARQLKRA